MKRIKLLSALAAFTFLIASCTAATPATPTQPPPLPTVPVTVEPTPTLASGAPQTEADVPRVSVEEAAAAIKSGEAVVVDVRSADAYQQSHIPGALSIPLFGIEQNPASVGLDKTKWIITYCT